MPRSLHWESRAWRRQAGSLVSRSTACGFEDPRTNLEVYSGASDSRVSGLQSGALDSRSAAFGTKDPLTCLGSILEVSGLGPTVWRS